jgi:hypothetical protein
VLACVDLGEGIFGELGGQGGSLRKSLSKRDLPSPPALGRQGGQGGRGGLGVLACVDLGKGIFGELGGQGGSLRKSLCKRDLFFLPASDRQGGQGGKGTGAPTSIDFRASRPAPPAFLTAAP